jgi:ABC-2 type transport system ATP-binding protein
MSIIVSNLSKVYGEQRAVDGISFEAKKGEVLGFLGPNGAGKTTTMKVITCFTPPTEGQVEVCGFPVGTESLEVQRRIGYLPEHNPLYKDMYVREYLHFVAGLHGIRKPAARVDEMVERTGLQREQHKPIGALSKGYRQRVGLAQAMLHDPEVLILDEPTSGLDPNQLVDIRNLIIELGREKTVIFSTHIMQEVQAICNRVLIINQGRIVANDPIELLQQRIEGGVVVVVAFAGTPSLSELEKIPGVTKARKLDQNRYELIGTEKGDFREAVFRFAVEKNLPLLEMQRLAYSVEDVFQRLTKSAAL